MEMIDRFNEILNLYGKQRTFNLDELNVYFNKLMVEFNKEYFYEILDITEIKVYNYWIGASENVYHISFKINELLYTENQLKQYLLDKYQPIELKRKISRIYGND